MKHKPTTYSNKKENGGTGETYMITEQVYLQQHSRIDRGVCPKGGTLHSLEGLVGPRLDWSGWLAHSASSNQGSTFQLNQPRRMDGILVQPTQPSSNLPPN